MKAVMKKILIFTYIIALFNYNVFAYESENDEEYEDLDYVWLDETIEEAKKQENEPEILSKCAVAYDRKSKTIIWGKNENQRVPMASTTKIMSAIILLENANLSDEIIVCKEAATIQGSRLGLKTNDKITYNDLLYGLMLCSRK